MIQLQPGVYSVEGSVINYFLGDVALGARREEGGGSSSQKVSADFATAHDGNDEHPGESG
jgi:hypothetical protein